MTEAWRHCAKGVVPPAASLCVLASLLVGCAGTSWLQSVPEEEALTELPAHRYPTAVHPSFRPPVSSIVTAGTEGDTPAVEAQPIVPEDGDEAPKLRLDRPQTPITPLAAIPPQYRSPTPDSSPTATGSGTPPSVVADATSAGSAATDENLPPIVSANDLPRPTSLPPAEQTVPAVVRETAPSPEVEPAGDSLAAGSAGNSPAVKPAADAADAADASAAVGAEVAAPVVILTGASRVSGQVEIEDTKQTAPLSVAERAAQVESLLGELIGAMQAELDGRRAEDPADEELPRLEQSLRMVQLAAGRMDDAALEVESLDAAQREAYKHLMFAIGVWLSPDEARRAPLRSAKVLRSLRDAASELSAASKLELRNLAFCDRVEYFGWYNEFPRYEFRPKQPVILYVEVNNFAAELKSAGYETELQGSYQVFDAGGRIVAERQLPLDREVCRNFRRDYFLAWPIYMPDSVAPGRYRMELSIEDLKASGAYQGRKFGEGIIEFTIRP